MLKILRYAIGVFLLCSPTFFPRLFKYKKSKAIKIVIFILAVCIIWIPFECLFLKFDTPEKAFKYSMNKAKIITVIEKEQSALFIYDEKGSTSAKLVNNQNGKWKAPFFPDDFILSRLENNNIFMIVKEKNSNNFYLMLTVSPDVKAVTDNYDSVFEAYYSDPYFASYVAYVENCTGDYIVNLDNEAYQINYQ